MKEIPIKEILNHFTNTGDSIYFYHKTGHKDPQLIEATSIAEIKEKFSFNYAFDELCGTHINIFDNNQRLTFSSGKIAEKVYN